MKLFGTDGIRGKANILLTPNLAFKIGTFLGQYLKSNKILLARDTRISGPMLLNSLVAGILSSGGQADTLEVAPTPALAYLVKKHGYDYGIMISASHNPFADNGIKIFDANGFKIQDEIERQIESFIESGNTVALKTGGDIGLYHDRRELLQEYVSYCQEVYRSPRSLNLLLDAAHGSATAVIGEVVKNFPGTIEIINNAPTGVNINENCGSTHLDVLADLIRQKETKFDLGVAFDGDADRLLIVGANGEEFDGDYIIYALAKHYQKQGLLKDNTVVVTVMANYGLFKAFEAIGIKVVKTDVGDKYVQRAMVDNGYLLGGEQSGHIIFNGFIKTGDGIFSFMKLLDVLAREQTTLAEYTKEFKKYPQTLINKKVNQKKRAMEDPTLLQEIEVMEKRLDGHGRILVRASGTEELVRVMVEAKTQALAQEIAEHLIKFVS